MDMWSHAFLLVMARVGHWLGNYIIQNINSMLLKKWKAGANYRVIVYLSFVQHKNPKVVCNLHKGYILSWFWHSSFLLDYTNYLPSTSSHCKISDQTIEGFKLQELPLQRTCKMCQHIPFEHLHNVHGIQCHLLLKVTQYYNFWLRR